MLGTYIADVFLIAISYHNNWKMKTEKNTSYEIDVFFFYFNPKNINIFRFFFHSAFILV